MNKEIFNDPNFCNSEKEECENLYLGKCNLFNEYLCCDSTVFSIRLVKKCDKCKGYYHNENQVPATNK